MPTHLPQYHALPIKQRREITRHLIKASLEKPHGLAIRRELDKIEAELKRLPEPAQA